MRARAARGDLDARAAVAAIDAQRAADKANTTPDPDAGAGPRVGSVGHHKALHLAHLAEERADAEARQSGHAPGTVAAYRAEYAAALRNAPHTARD